jgi:large subunit ribosomal protein L3
MKGLLGFKRGMTRVFDEDGIVAPVTVIEAGPCVVTQIKTEDKDGYSAVQLGFGEVRSKALTKAQRGHLSKSGERLKRHLREFRTDDTEGIQVGETIDVSLFAPGDRVHVTGISRGLGTAGTIKRHGFHRQRKTHGQSDRERAPGSVGAGTTPGRTHKGKRMAGHMGNERVTVRNLEVVVADPERNLLAVRGSVPGGRGSLVIVRAAEKGGAS